MNTAFGYLLGTVFMIVSETEAIVEDRHLNIMLSACIQYSYLLSAVFMLSETVALFRGITEGITGGKTAGYIFIGHGIPIINVGLTIFLYHVDYGRHPQGFIGWANDTKLPFFIGMLASGWLSFILSAILGINLSTPQTRRESKIDALAPQVHGLFGITFIFSITWTFGYFAYIRDPDAEILNFYPIFHLINSWIGVFIFCFLGVISQKFRDALLRKKMSKKSKYRVGELNDISEDEEDIEDVTEVESGTRRESMLSNLSSSVIQPESDDNNEEENSENESDAGSDEDDNDSDDNDSDDNDSDEDDDDSEDDSEDDDEEEDEEDE